MPELLGLDKKKWLWVGVAVAGVAGLYLLTHRGAASSGAAGDASDLPQTGPPPMGNQTPAGSFFDPGEQVAAFQSSQDRFLQLRQAQAAFDIAPTGAVSKAWRQLTNGMWEDIYHPGHVISEEQAQALGPQNHGPYAQGKGGFFGQVWQGLLGVASFALPNVAAAYKAGQPITAGSAFLGAKTTRPATTPRYTPPIAPSRIPQYGNTPALYGKGDIGEV